MTIVNHEAYVSLEVAKLLKEAGFNWECDYHYADNTLCHGFCNNDPMFKIIISAPTLDVAQRWLREEKEYYVDVTFRNLSLDYRPRIHKMIKGTSHMIYLGDIISSYESAQEAGIKKALEIILEK